MKKIFDELIEKKAQESLKRENEQNIRKARLAIIISFTKEPHK